MREIESLNRRLADSLGRIAGQPRFQWAWAPDLHYYHRNDPGQSWTRHSWGERLGKVWVLARAAPPVGIQEDRAVPITQEQWHASFHGEFPFPANVTLRPFAETALMQGLVPDEQDTAFYIHSLDQQMNQSMRQIKESIDQGLAKDRQANKQEFFDMADDSFPAFWSSQGGAHTPGKRGGHISFGA